MNSTEIVQKHAQLMEKWKAARPDYDFATDGILRPEVYWKQKPRIAFLLKESTDGFAQIAPLPDDNPGHGPYGNSPRFWRNMSIWNYVVTQIWNGSSCDTSEIPHIKEMPVNSIAYINVKKDMGSSVANDNELWSYAQNDKDFLAEQIDLCKPQVIICGGYTPFNIYRQLLSPECVGINDNIYATKNCLIINWYHPAYFAMSYKSLFTTLVNWLSEPKVTEVIKRL
jgi:hypothetical protein